MPQCSADVLVLAPNRVVQRAGARIAPAVVQIQIRCDAACSTHLEQRGRHFVGGWVGQHLGRGDRERRVRHHFGCIAPGTPSVAASIAVPPRRASPPPPRPLPTKVIAAAPMLSGNPSIGGRARPSTRRSFYSSTVIRSARGFESVRSDRCPGGSVRRWRGCSRRSACTDFAISRSRESMGEPEFRIRCNGYGSSGSTEMAFAICTNAPCSAVATPPALSPRNTTSVNPSTNAVPGSSKP